MAQKLNLKEIYGICLAENTASVRVLKKCGFTQNLQRPWKLSGERRANHQSNLEKLQLKLQLLIPCFYKFAGR